MSFISSKRLIRIMILLTFLGGFAYFLFYTKTGVILTHSNIHRLSDHLKSMGIYGQVIGVVSVFVQTFIPFIPFVVVAGTNVAIFGLKWGFIVNYGMSILGAVSLFFFARYYGHGWVEKKLQRFPLLIQFSKRMETHGFMYVFLGRLIPVLPSSTINIAAGLTGTRFNAFLAGTIIGKLPIVFLESMIAHDLFQFHKYKARLLMLLAIFVLLMVIGHWFKKRLSPRSSIEKSSESE